jgi:tetrathionate reductase subunit B
MSKNISRRKVLAGLGAAAAAMAAAPAAKAQKRLCRRCWYPRRHRAITTRANTSGSWRIDINRCIGCGLCAEACKKENNVCRKGPYFRTWVERYVIAKPEPGSGETRGKTYVDSPERRHAGFPAAARSERSDPALLLRAEALQPLPSFAVRAGVPGGRDLRRSGWSGADRSEVLHWLRLLHPGLPVRLPVLNPHTHTAEKCSLCYHRISRGLKPACVEVCPTRRGYLEI